MNKISYNQARSTFAIGQVVIAGVLVMQTLPAIAKPDRVAQCNKSISGASYRVSTHAATYSRLSGLLTGEYSHATQKTLRPWLTSELENFLLHSPRVSLMDLDHLLLAIRETYGDVRVDFSIHTDPEEGWTKPVVIVHSGMEDFDALMDVEDSFFGKADNDAALLAVLPFVVVSQA